MVTLEPSPTTSLDASATTARALRPRSVRGIARHGALDILSRIERLRPDPRERQPCVQLLLLHHLFKDEAPAFRRLLAHLSRRYRLVSYSDAVARIAVGQVDRSCLAVSFDDGLKSCLTAARILEDFDATACFFVCPGVVGATGQAAAEFCRDRLRHAPAELLDWRDLESLRSRGHEIGAHTVTHRNLSEAPPSEAVEEITESRRLLERRLGPVRHFAWPYGGVRDVTPAALRAVVEAGFESCASGVRGCHAPGGSAPGEGLARCLRRDSIVAAWPLAHIDYFLRRGARRPVNFTTAAKSAAHAA